MALLAALLLAGSAHGLEIPRELSSIVAFLYKGSAASARPLGTAFFVGVQKPGGDYYWLYLVTAKHVLRDKEGGWAGDALLRLNTADGGSALVPLPLRDAGPRRTVFTHPDPTVDLAVIPLRPDPAVYDYGFLPERMILGREQLAASGIAAGDDVFFAGLFQPHPGAKRNAPIMRFGRIALLSDERVEFTGQPTRLHLLELSSYGGNSGSPAFVHVDLGRAGAPSLLALLGVVKGAFLDAREVKEVDAAAGALSFSNMGIAAAVPADELRAILDSAELEELRAAGFFGG